MSIAHQFARHFHHELPRHIGRAAQGLARGALFSVALAHSGSAAAAVLDVAANGFAVQETAHIAAAPDKVYAALITPSQWWDSHHTFSGNAANLTLDPHAGGCWCETLSNGGSVQHLIVVDAEPGSRLRLRGALGPFQAMGADGALTYVLQSDPNGTTVTLSYSLGGYSKDGFEHLAPAADLVLGNALTRLKQFVETGSPQTAPSH